MKAIRLVILIVLALTPLQASADRTIEAPKAPKLSNGADSMEELIDRFLRALERGDRQALRDVRVSKAEYLRIVLPGFVPPGQPLKRYPSTMRRWAWDNLNTKSMFYESIFLNTLGGKHLTVDRFDYREGGGHQFALYTGHRQLELFVRDATGEEHEVETGSVVERDGKYKFISFIRE
jgi:hypothetical protein